MIVQKYSDNIHTGGFRMFQQMMTHAGVIYMCIEIEYSTYFGSWCGGAYYVCSPEWAECVCAWFCYLDGDSPDCLDYSIQVNYGFETCAEYMYRSHYYCSGIISLLQKTLSSHAWSIPCIVYLCLFKQKRYSMFHMHVLVYCDLYMSI